MLKFGPPPHRTRLGEHSRRTGRADRLRNVGPARGAGDRHPRFMLSPDFRQAHVRSGTRRDGRRSRPRRWTRSTHAKQFLRHQLAERLQLFHTPDLHFEAALPAELGAKVPQILKRIKRGRPYETEKKHDFLKRRCANFVEGTCFASSRAAFLAGHSAVSSRLEAARTGSIERLL